MSANWQQRLDAAKSEAEVVHVAREYIAQINSDVIACLPAELRPRDFKDAGEVAAYAFNVAVHRLHGGGTELAGQVQTIATFFMSAATRLTQITTSPGKAA